MSVDYVDDIDVGNGVLTSNNYYALYVTGPNVSAAAQSKINSWGAPNGEHWPSFTQNVGFVSLESIVHSYAEPLIPGRGSTRLSEGWSTSTLQHVDPGRGRIVL